MRYSELFDGNLPNVGAGHAREHLIAGMARSYKRFIQNESMHVVF